MTAEMDHKGLALADVIESFDRCAGLLCTRVGEDGDVLILGHHDDAVCWAAFEALTGDDSGSDSYDLRRTQVAWSVHSEGCELIGCSCEEDALCPACRTSEHDKCDGTCECAADYDHDLPAKWTCGCECYCDEYAWWVSNVKANGEPATWVSWSYAKARAHQEALRTPPGRTTDAGGGDPT